MKSGRLLVLLIMIFSIIALEITASNIKSTSGNVFIDANNDGTNDHVIGTGQVGIGTTSPSANLQVQSGNAYISGNLMIGTTSTTSTLQVQGTIGFGVDAPTASSTASDNTVIIANTLNNDITITLPFAGNVSGRHYYIKKKNENNTLTVVTENSANIDGFSSIVVTTSENGFPFLKVASDGSNWYILSSNTD